MQFPLPDSSSSVPCLYYMIVPKPSKSGHLGWWFKPPLANMPNQNRHHQAGLKRNVWTTNLYKSSQLSWWFLVYIAFYRSVGRVNRENLPIVATTSSELRAEEHKPVSVSSSHKLAGKSRSNMIKQLYNCQWSWYTLIIPDPDPDPDDDDDDDDDEIKSNQIKSNQIKSNQIKSNRERYVDSLGPRHRCIEGQLTPSHLACLPITSEKYVFNSILWSYLLISWGHCLFYGSGSRPSVPKPKDWAPLGLHWAYMGLPWKIAARRPRTQMICCPSPSRSSYTSHFGFRSSGMSSMRNPQSWGGSRFERLKMSRSIPNSCFTGFLFDPNQPMPYPFFT